ncbi:hypothetical protein COOONC_12084, partial [Cooperia oncophora]
LPRLISLIFQILERLRDCDDNIKSAAKLLEYSAITGSVLQLGAEQLRYDPDVNEFERDVAVLMLKDPQITYTGETMNRPKSVKPPEAAENKSSGKGKAAPKAEQKSEPEKEKTALEFEKSKPIGKTQPSELPDEENKQGKRKFKPPPNITKADAKDPQYETLRGIGNELFAGDKDKEKNEEVKEVKKEGPSAEGQQAQAQAAKKFKQPPKVQKVDAKDPQYETLADVKDDIFKG